jgi:glyoxalase family protein
MTVLGLHHITLVCSDAQRTVDFYTQVLGQRLVKKTVNFDDPTSYHLYFGDELGRPGSAITFFEWPDAPRGAPGIGGTHHLALQVAEGEGLLKWKRRLTDLGLLVTGPLDQHYFQSICFSDPDGVLLEIATRGPGWAIDKAADRPGHKQGEPPREMVIRNPDETRRTSETWPEPVPDITPDMALMRGMHHITAISSDLRRTHAFWSDLLGLRRVKMTNDLDDPTSAHWYWGVDEGQPGTVITYLERRPGQGRRARMGVGQTHHFAFAVSDEAIQLKWRDKLIQAGLRVSPVMDRVYFKSIYTNDPDGHIVELATAGPGFAVDEDANELGTQLRLPPWLENYRAEIERALRPVAASPWRVRETA